MVRIAALIQKVAGLTRKGEERLIKHTRFSILVVDVDEKYLLVKDTQNESISEISMVKTIGNHYILYCKTCSSSKCCHTIFAYYSHEAAMMKAVISTTNDLGKCFEMILNPPEPIRRRIRDTKLRSILQCNIIPAIGLTILSLSLLPIFANSLDGSWHTMNYFLDMGNTLGSIRRV